MSSISPLYFSSGHSQKTNSSPELSPTLKESKEPAKSSFVTNCVIVGIAGAALAVLAAYSSRDINQCIQLMGPDKNKKCDEIYRNSMETVYDCSGVGQDLIDVGLGSKRVVSDYTSWNSAINGNEISAKRYATLERQNELCDSFLRSDFLKEYKACKEKHRQEREEKISASCKLFGRPLPVTKHSLEGLLEDSKAVEIFGIAVASISLIGAGLKYLGTMLSSEKSH